MPALLPSTSTLLTKVKGILPAQNIKNDLEMIGVLNSKLATIVYNRDGLFPSSFFIPLPVSTCILRRIINKELLSFIICVSQLVRYAYHIKRKISASNKTKLRLFIS